MFQLDIAETGGQGGSEIIIIESDDVEVEKGSEIKGHGTGELVDGEINLLEKS